MPLDAERLNIAARGDLYVAPVGTTMPADVTASLNAAFRSVGYLNEDGATLSDSKNRDPIMAWQAFRPIAYVNTDVETTLACTLRQWDNVTVPLAFGGGTITSPSAGVYRYAPPAPEFIDERAAVLEWVQDTYKWRLCMTRVMLTESVETQLVRTSPGDLPITLGVLGSVGVDDWYILTSAPGMSPTAS